MQLLFQSTSQSRHQDWWNWRNSPSDLGQLQTWSDLYACRLVLLTQLLRVGLEMDPWMCQSLWILAAPFYWWSSSCVSQEESTRISTLAEFAVVLGIRVSNDCYYWHFSVVVFGYSSVLDRLVEASFLFYLTVFDVGSTNCPPTFPLSASGKGHRKYRYRKHRSRTNISRRERHEHPHTMWCGLYSNSIKQHSELAHRKPKTAGCHFNIMSKGYDACSKHCFTTNQQPANIPNSFWAYFRSFQVSFRRSSKWKRLFRSLGLVGSWEVGWLTWLYKVMCNAFQLQVYFSLFFLSLQY